MFFTSPAMRVRTSTDAADGAGDSVTEIAQIVVLQRGAGGKADLES